ncbi:serine palmitoyltransferase [Peniophora sp. CONT]|nr:serine palmitoyltransferase [Peniophora sp. CONT]
MEGLNTALGSLEHAFYKLPGSHVIARYVRSSHQNDPGRTVLELLLFLFLVRTVLQSRTRAGDAERHFIKFSEKEIDELVDDWQPEPLGAPLTESEQSDLSSVQVVLGSNGPKPRLASHPSKPVINFASFNFTGLAGDERVRERAIDILHKYGLGSCGPPGFYGTFDVHLDLERDIADFLGTESAIVYSQAYSAVASVITAFAKRHDVIVADRGVGFAIQQALKVSRSTVRWYDHNDYHSLEQVLEHVDKEHRKRKGPLTRRFIVTEGMFERDGQIADLPRIVELKNKYKFRLILDESLSFGTLGRTGRGLTELYNVPAPEVDIFIGSLAAGLNAAGGFCAGSRVVTEHQRINGTSFVYSAAMPALLAAGASTGMTVLRETPSLLAVLQENVHAVRAVLDKSDVLEIPSHPAAPIITLHIKPTSASSLSPSAVPPSSSGKHSNPTHILPAHAPVYDIEKEESLLQEIVDECLSQGVWLSRAKRLKNEDSPARPSLRVCVSGALAKKEAERAAGVVKAVASKVLGKKR